MILPDLTPELHFQATRSGGKGGQHVNKVSSRIDLSFDIAASAYFTPEQKQVLLEKLASRITKEGLLRLTEQGDRSQHENKAKAIKKLYELLKRALTPKKKRVATKTPKSVREKRLKTKKAIGEKKQLRRGGKWDD